ncbi:MAG: DNA repair protein RecO [Clostridia bacterium]|nr:DNA repair protein RecO [Clostridia bacterium]
MSCAAKGARRPKSALLAGSQLLCFGEYMLYQGTSTYHINSCETIEMFYNLRTDLDKLKYASHITKIIYDVTNENENSYKILQLFLNTLYTISETDKDMDLVVSIFKLRLMCILGFTPSIRTAVKNVKQKRIFYILVLKIADLSVVLVGKWIRA